uniref:Putative serine protease K12H4.7 n=1 Tax=Lygus hesperus TaxID=30085 RepID=A0A0A9XL49_LYGHE
MRCLFLLALCFVVSFANSVFAKIPGDDGVAADQWLVQKLDHFDPSSSRTWWQKYHTNETWFRNSRKSPVFLLIGGNHRTKAKSVAEGAFVDYARKFGALCFQIEHRFYGASLPTDDLTVSNLRFLIVDQALADIAFFVKQMNARYKLTSNNRWVVFGKGYAGSLAAWARLKYSHLIHAAVSSSAPLQAVNGYSGFDENIKQVLSSSTASCPEQIHEAALNIENLLKTPNGVDILTRKFKRCNSLNPKSDTEVAFFVESLARHFRGAVESALNEPSITSTNHHHTIDEICSLMGDEKFGNALDRYAAVHSLFTFGNLFTSGKCKDDNFNDYISAFRDESNFNVSRIWLYQRCTEFGFFPISTSKNSLFGSLIDLKFYVNTCQQIFGDGFDAKRLTDGVARTNMMYGGLDLESSRIISIVGDMDLWRDLGLQKSSKA